MELKKEHLLADITSLEAHMAATAGKIEYARALMAFMDREEPKVPVPQKTKATKRRKK